MHKKVCHAKPLKFQDYKSCLEASPIENKINHFKKIKLALIVLKKINKEFINNNKLILKAQQLFRNEKHVFTEEINKIAFSYNDYKRMQSID